MLCQERLDGRIASLVLGSSEVSVLAAGDGDQLVIDAGILCQSRRSFLDFCDGFSLRTLPSLQPTRRSGQHPQSSM